MVIADPWRGFPRVGGARGAGRPAARLQSGFGASLDAAYPRSAARVRRSVAAAGRAQRGLDLFLGQNRTSRGGR